MCRNEYLGKPKLSIQLKLVRDMKSNMKSFCWDTGGKKTKESVRSLLNVMCDLVTKVENSFSAIRGSFVPGIIDCHHYWMYVNDSGVFHLRIEIDLFINVVACSFVILVHKPKTKELSEAVLLSLAMSQSW